MCGRSSRPRGADRNKTVKSEPAADFEAECDFLTLKRGVRGKYARRYAEGTNPVLLAPDVAELFAGNEAVNEALRLLIRLARTKARGTSATPSGDG